MRRIFTTALMVAALCLGSNVQADIFLGNIDGSTTFDLSMGNSGTIGVFVEDEFSIDTGAFLNAFGGEGISIVSAEVFNPEIIVAGTSVDTRWQSTDNGTVVGDHVIDFSGFSVTEGAGILPDQTTGGVFEDTGHIAGLGFLFAELTWELTGSSDLGGDNIATIELGVGTGLIINDGVALDPTFGNFTITNSVPEPTAFGWLTLGFVGLVVRRRR